MNSLLISPSESLIEVVAAHLVGSGKDYSSNLVIFPGKRPSHFLRKALAAKEGSSFLPPSVLSMDEFIDQVYSVSLDSQRRKIEPIDAVSILYRIHTTSPEHLGELGFLNLDTFFPIGTKIYHDLEELLIEGVTPQRVKEVDLLAGKGIPEQTAKRLQSLSYFYESFYRRIEEEGLSTRSSRYRTVSLRIEEVHLRRFRRVVVAGFFALTRSEREVFKSLMKRESVLFIFQEGEGIKQRLSDLGIRAQKRLPSREPTIHCYQSPDSHGQVLGVSKLLKDWRDRGKQVDEKTVVVLPSAETLLPLIHQALVLLDPEGYNVSLGYPLERTPLFGFFNNLTKVVTTMDGDRLYLPDYLEFILHPYTKNITFRGRADLTRILFHSIEEVLTGKRTKKFLSLEEVEQDEDLADSLKERIFEVEPGVTLAMMRDHLVSIHENTIRKMFRFDNIGEFATKLREVIEYIYRHSTARLHPFFYPYAESFISQLDLLSRSLMKEMRFQDVGSYFSLFKRHLLSVYVPFAGTPLRGMQVLGFLETRNLKFDTVIFLDANEGVVPDTTREDTLLPFQSRLALGLPTYLDREELMAYHFDTLVRGARETHLFYVENDDKERSRLVERLIWERQKREGKRNDSSYVQTVQYAIDLKRENPLPIAKSPEVISWLKEYPFSATSLNTYLNCPLRFYYQYVLGLREREVVSEEFEGEEIGSLVHRVLYRYFERKVGFVLSERDFSIEEFEKVFRHEFEEAYGADPTGGTYLLRTQVERHLRDFIRHYQVPMVKEFQTEILALEQPIEVVWNSFKLVARLDRVERRAGRKVIVDYKTTANRDSLAIRFKKLRPDQRDSWREAIGSLQLPCYLFAYAALTGEKPESIDCMFLLLGKARIESEIELRLFTDETEAEEGVGLLSQVMLGLLKEIVDPERPFLPTGDPKKDCAQCAYEYICTNHNH